MGKGLQQGMDDKVAILDTLACYTLGTSTAATRRVTTIKLAVKEQFAGVYGQDLRSYPRIFQDLHYLSTKQLLSIKLILTKSFLLAD